MKKMPLVMILFLISIVLIMGVADSSKDSGGKSERHEFFSKYVPCVGTASPDKELAFPGDEKLFLADNIKKSEEMADHLEDIVHHMEEDNDVKKLEEMVENYRLLVSLSRDYLSKADNSTSFSEEQKYLYLSREKIIYADMELKKIFTRMQSYLPEPLTLYGNESLNASGAGMAILSGDLDIDLSISEGKFTTVDFAGDLDIYTTELNGSEIKSGQVMVPHGDGMQQILSYNDVRGDVILSGSSLTVAIMSNNINFNVTGTGKVELYGNGTYMLSNESMNEKGIWISPVFDMKR